MTAPFAPCSEIYFIPVACFLLFNMMDWAGRSLTAVCMWVSTGFSDDAIALCGRITRTHILVCVGTLVEAAPWQQLYKL